MKKIILIIVLCVFASVTKSLAQSVGYEITSSENQSFGVYLGGSSYTMQAYMQKAQYAMGSDYGCDLRVYNNVSQEVGSIIWGPYNGGYNDGSTSSSQSIYVSSNIYYLWIRSHNVIGWVGIYW